VTANGPGATLKGLRSETARGSIPDVLLIEFDAMLLQETPVLLLKRQTSVVFLLAGNIPLYSGPLGLTHGERPVASLIHETCVIKTSSAAKRSAALVAQAGPSAAGNVASVASPTTNTLKSWRKFT
jgi:hypothetical protein